MQHKRKTAQWRFVMSADIALWPQARHGIVLEMSIKDSLPSTGLRAREQQKQGYSSREKESGDTGHHPTDLSRAMVRRAPSRWNGGSDPGLFSELQQEISLKPATIKYDLGVQAVPGQQEDGLGSGIPAIFCRLGHPSTSLNRASGCEQRVWTQGQDEAGQGNSCLLGHSQHWN